MVSHVWRENCCSERVVICIQIEPKFASMNFICSFFAENQVHLHFPTAKIIRVPKYWCKHERTIVCLHVLFIRYSFWPSSCKFMTRQVSNFAMRMTPMNVVNQCKR